MKLSREYLLMGDSITPGAYALTVIPCRPSSTASKRISKESESIWLIYLQLALYLGPQILYRNMQSNWDSQLYTDVIKLSEKGRIAKCSHIFFQLKNSHRESFPLALEQSFAQLHICSTGILHEH